MSLSRIVNRIDGLSPGTRTKALLFIALAADKGIPVRVTQALRSMAEQDALYAQGRLGRVTVNKLRAKAGMPKLKSWQRNRIVTHAMPGSSWHNYGRAFDIVPMVRGEKLLPQWASPWWAKLGELGKECGLEWGGDWTKPDRPHFQNREGKTLVEARAEVGIGT